jgi:MFS superfamily sulfate permease-like transporter
MISGLIGGLPITSVVVRTSANVYAGARTWMSSFIHGALLFSSTMFIPGVLNLTPLCSLAAILIVIGYKLTKPKLYKDMYRAGIEQFLPFIVTVTAIVVTDLLTGVLVGLVFGAFFVIRTNHHDAISLVNQDRYFLMRFNKDATFVNKSELRTKLRSLPSDSHLILDGTKAIYMDRDIHEVIEDFRQLAPYKNITLETKNI